MTISNVANLKDRLRAKMEDDREQTESLIKEHLSELSENLKDSINDELSSIRENLESETDKLNEEADKLKKILAYVWVRPLVIGLALLLGISAGSWGLMQYLSWSVRDLLNDRRQISAQIETAQNTLNGLESKTWGLKLLKEKGKKYVILPIGYIPETGLTYGKGKNKREAIKMSRR